MSASKVHRHQSSLGKQNLRMERKRLQALLLTVFCAAAIALLSTTAPQHTELFENPETPEDDADSWTIQGILDDGIDGDTAADPFKLDDASAEREARRKARLGLKQIGQQTTSLLGGDDWLGAPFAVPEDVRDHGEQQIGRDVTYWNTHSGQIGTGHGGATYPYSVRSRRGQMLRLMPKPSARRRMPVSQAQTQILKRLSADDANAQVSGMHKC